MSLARMLNQPAYDEVEPRKTHEGATFLGQMGLPELHHDVYEENNIDGTFPTVSRTRTIFYSLYKVGFLIPLRKNTIIHTRICYHFY